MDNKSVAFFYFGRFPQPYKNSKNVIVRQQVAAKKNIKKHNPALKNTQAALSVATASTAPPVLRTCRQPLQSLTHKNACFIFVFHKKSTPSIGVLFQIIALLLI